jgi:hypothetical protein
MANNFSHGYALLIGVGQSAYANWSLPVSVKDIQSLKAILVDSNLCAYLDNDQHIRLLHDQGATRQAILGGLKWLRIQVTSDPEATAIIYYSGHGWLDKARNHYYLVQHDIKPFDLAGSALSAVEFTQELAKIQAKRMLVVIDSCHAQGMVSAKDGKATLELPKGFEPSVPSKDLFDPLIRGEGRAVFTSCRGIQQSWIRKDNSMSIYTHHLVEALQGAASQLGDTMIKVSDLMKHLGRTVPESAYSEYQVEQVPWFSCETEDFPIALLRGGKGLPKGGWEAVESKASEQRQALFQAVGDRSVVVSGSVSGTVITGDGNLSISNTRDVSMNQEK